MTRWQAREGGYVAGGGSWRCFRWGGCRAEGLAGTGESAELVGVFEMIFECRLAGVGLEAFAGGFGVGKADFGCSFVRIGKVDFGCSFGVGKTSFDCNFGWSCNLAGVGCRKLAVERVEQVEQVVHVEQSGHFGHVGHVGHVWQVDCIFAGWVWLVLLQLLSTQDFINHPNFRFLQYPISIHFGLLQYSHLQLSLCTTLL